LVIVIAAKLVARLHATAAIWVRIQTSLKNIKWPTHTKNQKTKTQKQKTKKYIKTVQQHRECPDFCKISLMG
jgi:hypothetical protein